jgi:hypothetical protein
VARRIGFPYPYLDESPVFLILETLMSSGKIAKMIPDKAKNTKAKQKEIPKPRKSHAGENPRVWIMYELVYSLHSGFIGSLGTGQGHSPPVGLAAEPTNSFNVKVIKP